MNSASSRFEVIGLYKNGQVVIPKCGRDKGYPFVVVAIDGDYLYLADGDRRMLAKPKKKKCKHVQATNTVFDHQVFKMDAEIRKALKCFKAEEV